MMKEKWKETSLSHKIITVVTVITSLGVVVLSILQMFDIWAQAIKLYMPLTGGVMLCQAYMQWNISRKVAYFSIGTAIFVFACSIVVFLIK